MTALRLGVLASGRGSNLQAIIDAIENETLPASIEVVISNRRDSLALERAQRHALTGIFLDPALATGTDSPNQTYDQHILQVLEQHRVDLVLLAGYMKVISPLLVKPYQWRMMNIHPSLLPAFPGLHAQRQALEWGAKVSGCTVHFVTEGVDTGPIILQAAVPVLETDTVDSLSSRILEQEHVLYPQAIQLFLEKRLRIEGRRAHLLSAPGNDGTR